MQRSIHSTVATGNRLLAQPRADGDGRKPEQYGSIATTQRLFQAQGAQQLKLSLKFLVQGPVQRHLLLSGRRVRVLQSLC